MPTYQYVCTDCGERLEVQQSFSDHALSDCPTCDGRLRKVFGAVGVVFKGSGFYRTDSRAAESKTSSDGDGKPAAKESGSDASKPKDTTAGKDRKPATTSSKPSATKDSAA